MAVTGLVVPHELETKAQLLFEINGGLGRGLNGNGITWVVAGRGEILCRSEQGFSVTVPTWLADPDCSSRSGPLIRT